MPDFNDELYTDIEHMCFLTYGQAGQIVVGIVLIAALIAIIFKIWSKLP